MQRTRPVLGWAVAERAQMRANLCQAVMSWMLAFANDARKRRREGAEAVLDSQLTTNAFVEISDSKSSAGAL